MNLCKQHRIELPAETRQWELHWSDLAMSLSTDKKPSFPSPPLHSLVNNLFKRSLTLTPLPLRGRRT